MELAELSLDADFRAHMRRLATEQAAEQARSGRQGPRPDLTAVVRELVVPALTAGIAPDAPQADPIVAALVARCDDFVDRRRLPARLELLDDPRKERYFRLLAVINGWPAPESLRPVRDWSLHALRVRTAA